MICLKLQILFYMRSILFAVLCLLGSTFSLSACDVATMSTLAEISRPYAGEYKCERLTLGSRDLLGDKDLRLNLKQDGTFALFFAGKKRAELTGQYEFSDSGEAVSFTARSKTRSFPVEDGAIYMQFPLRGKLLLAEFSFV